MKALLIPLAAAAALAGCAVDPYYGGNYGYGYGNGYGYGYPATSVTIGSSYYGGAPVYRSQERGLRDRDRDGIPNRMDADRDGDGIPNRMDARPNNPRR